jgi:hypothetical protein
MMASDGWPTYRATWGDWRSGWRVGRPGVSLRATSAWPSPRPSVTKDAERWRLCRGTSQVKRQTSPFRRPVQVCTVKSHGNDHLVGGLWSRGHPEVSSKPINAGTRTAQGDPWSPRHRLGGAGPGVMDVDTDCVSGRLVPGRVVVGRQSLRIQRCRLVSKHKAEVEAHGPEPPVDYFG